MESIEEQARQLRSIRLRHPLKRGNFCKGHCPDTNCLRIGVVGINHKLASLELREQLASVCQRRFGAGVSIHGVHSFVLLSTCNRTEIYFSSENPAASHSYLLGVLRGDIEGEFDQKLYSYFNYDCFLHLCRVTAGLDSAILAETEIQGQVKAAYCHAHRWSPLPSSIHYTFQKALKMGKEVRTRLKLDKGLPDVEHALWHLGYRHLENPKSAKLLLVGSSKINIKVGAFLKSCGVEAITLANRTDEKGRRYAERLGFSHLPWRSLDRWEEYDWVIVATKAAKPLLTHSTSTNKLLIDLSVPRNIDPNIQGHHLYNIDEINELLAGRRPMQGVVEAEQFIFEQTRRYIDIYTTKTSSHLTKAAQSR